MDVYVSEGDVADRVQFTENDYIPLLVEYVKEIEPTEGYFDFNRIVAALNGKLVDKNGEKLDPVKYVKSTLNLMKRCCLVAAKIDGVVLVGFSQWAKSVDDYDPISMFNVAINRLFTCRKRYKKQWQLSIPFKVAEALPKFLNRAKAYFKDAKLVEWAEDFLVTPHVFSNRTEIKPKQPEQNVFKNNKFFDFGNT